MDDFVAELRAGPAPRFDRLKMTDTGAQPMDLYGLFRKSRLYPFFQKLEKGELVCRPGFVCELGERNLNRRV
jgi:hypothetical protein